MTTISFLNPIDQPTGRRRLLADLKSGLQNKDVTRLRIIVAFAKSGPLLRLQSYIEAWRAKGYDIEAIFGIDQQGTSEQALAFALTHFNRVYVTQEPNLTFHPKIYIFDGPSEADIYVGSNNLTVGGTETNFESSIHLGLSFPDDRQIFQQFEEAWTNLLPNACPATNQLNFKLLQELVDAGDVPDEKTMRFNAGGGKNGGGTRKLKTGLAVKPPSALPATKAKKSVPEKGAAGDFVPKTADGFVIQIKPHRNGEIFLSVTAALQKPDFFKWPFTGLTVPKRAGNPAYPQLTPDPKVNVTVYGASNTPLLTLNEYQLNTVYYETNSEIRITASPLVGVAPDYSIMIMYKGSSPGIDYDIFIHTPDSSDYAAWLATCNQQMPGGGSKPRKFGWL